MRSGEADDGVAVRDMRFNNEHISVAERERPQQLLMYEISAWVSRGVRSGTWRDW